MPINYGGHDALHPHIQAENTAPDAPARTDLPRTCNCVCRRCFYQWWYMREDGGRAFVGICICQQCPCEQRQIAERNRFASVLAR